MHEIRGQTEKLQVVLKTEHFIRGGGLYRNELNSVKNCSRVQNIPPAKISLTRQKASMGHSDLQYRQPCTGQNLGYLECHTKPRGSPTSPSSNFFQISLTPWSITNGHTPKIVRWISVIFKKLNCYDEFVIRRKMETISPGRFNIIRSIKFCCRFLTSSASTAYY